MFATYQHVETVTLSTAQTGDENTESNQLTHCLDGMYMYQQILRNHIKNDTC